MARPLRRLIQRTVEDTLSEELLSGRVQLGKEARLTVEDGRITVKELEKPQEAGTADGTETAAAELPENASAEAPKQKTPPKKTVKTAAPAEPETREAEKGEDFSG